MCVWGGVHVCVCVHIVAGAHRVQKRAPNSLEQEFQIVVSHLMWELGMEPGSSPRATQALNHLAITPARDFVLDKELLTKFSQHFVEILVTIINASVTNQILDSGLKSGFPVRDTHHVNISRRVLSRS